MLTLLTIVHYFVSAGVDLADKFLISKRKIQPLSYTFFTIISGAVLMVIWPFVATEIPGKFVGLNIFSGAWFAAALYFFFRALSQGEVSRVVPFVFGVVPVFDILLQVIFKLDAISLKDFSAMCLLIPGALLLTYKQGKFLGRHVAEKLLAAFMVSSYNILWHYSSQQGPVLNSLMWNRVGAAGMVLLILLVPAARRHILGVQHVEKKKNTSIVFLFKQLVGGLNFVFMSFLYSAGSVPVVSALQGFRYVFLFGVGAVLSKKYKHIVEEDTDKHTLRQKVVALVFMFIGTLILFL